MSWFKRTDAREEAVQAGHDYDAARVRFIESARAGTQGDAEYQALAEASIRSDKAERRAARKAKGCKR